MRLPRMTMRRLLVVMLLVVGGIVWTLGRRPAAVSVPMREPRDYLGESNTMTAVAFAPGGRTLASGGSDGKVRLWDLDGRRERSTLDLGKAVGVWPIAFRPGGEALIVGGNLRGGMVGGHVPGALSPPLQVWDPVSGVRRAGLHLGLQDHLRAMRVSADGRTLAIGGALPSTSGGTLVNVADWRERVILWDTATWTERSSFTLGPGQVAATAFDADLGTFAAASLDGTITLYDAATGRPSRTLKAGGAVMSLAISPDGRTLAVHLHGPSETIQFWDLETGLRRDSRPWPPSRKRSVLAFAPDGRTLAMTWSEIPGPYERLPMAFTRTLGIPPRRCEVVLWDIVSGRPRARLMAPATDILADVAFSPDGRTVVAVGRPGPIILWDVPSDGSSAERSP